MRRTGAAAAAVVLLLGVAACGDDDDDAATTTTEEDGGAPAGEAVGYCDGLVEFNSKVMEVELEDDASEEEVKAAGEELAPLFQSMVDDAPEAVADDASELNDTAIQPLLDGDAEAFNADETFAAYSALVEASGPECDFEELAVTAVDYAFQGVPATVPAGTYSLGLANEGTEEHEMVVFRKADGVTQSIQDIVQLPEEESESLVVFSGAAFAPPGESGSTLATLDPGDYGMVCFIPVGGAEDGPPHFTRGMLTEFTVE